VSVWPFVHFGEVASHRKSFFDISDAETYKRCRVQLHARGVVLRDEVPGSDIRTKKQQRCREDDFLVAEIDAKLGGYGRVPSSLAGAIVSSHYFLFEVNRDRILPEFLDFFAKTTMFFDQVRAQGSTNYAAIRPKSVLGYRVPLPPLDVQRRAVEFLDDFNRRCTQTEIDMSRSVELLRAGLRGAFASTIEGVRRVPLSSVAPLVRRPVQVAPDGDYPELGIRSFGKGTFHKEALSGMQVGTKKLFYIEPDDLLFNIVFAWEGAVAVAGPQDQGRVGSHRFLTCVADTTQVFPEFLRYYFLTDDGIARLGEASPGGAGRNRTLGVRALAELLVPVPELARQERFVALERQVRAVVARREPQLANLQAARAAALREAFRHVDVSHMGNDSSVGGNLTDGSRAEPTVAHGRP
jgi:type I restriction enzyme S subunit